MSEPQKYKLKSGVRWRVQYTDPDGIRRTKSGFKKKSHAEHWQAENIISKNTGSYIAPEAGLKRVAEIGESLVNSRTHLKPSTHTLLKSTWEIHVKPRWGNERVADIAFTDVEEWAAQIPGSPSTVRRAVHLLRQIMDRAMRLKLIHENPTDDIVLPRRSPARRVYLTAAQLQALAEHSAHPDMVMTLGTVGLRWGELAGLRVMDVDAPRRRLRIEQNAVRVAGKIHMTTPKTHERRTVAVSAPVMEMIVEACADKPPTALVWSQGDGTALKPPGHGKWLDTAVRRCQAGDPHFPRVTAHGLRHVAAGLLVSAGANPKVVQRQLGHASAAMTMDTYADLFDGDLDEVADVMGALLA